MNNTNPKSLIGCCGLYCGLCSKYQSQAPSRCIGCRPGEQHSWCSIWNCCVKKRGFDTCSECDEIFNCAIFLRRKVAEWVPAADNLRQIKEAGLDGWLNEQVARQALLEELLRDYNEGRSMSLYCKVCARMPLDLINEAVEDAKELLAGETAVEPDVKSRARVLKGVFRDRVLEAGISLE